MRHSSRSHRDRDSGSSRRYDREERYDRDRRSSRHSLRRSRSPSRGSASPPPRKRKKPSLWDVPPPSGSEVVTPPPAIAPPMMPPSANPNALNPHQSRQARRLYVGNVPDGVTETELAEFFNAAMVKAGVAKNDNPVVAVQMDTQKNFAFLEFSNPEDATAGMNFDGITLQGNSLKIRRPKDYKPMGDAVLMEAYRLAAERRLMQIPNLVSTNVQEGPNKIFIGGLPSYLTEEQVKELISSFGPLKSFNLVKDNVTGNSKGYAFFEYWDPDITDKACQGLNGMKLGEKTILVQRATLGAKQPTAQTTGAPDPSRSSPGILHNSTAQYFLNLGMPIAAAAALLSININHPGPPTRILQLANIVSSEQTIDDDEYEDIVADIKDECKRYGTVVSVHVPRSQPRIDNDMWAPDREATPPSDQPPQQPEVRVEWGVGKAFVEFSLKEEAAKAQSALAGRKFNNRTIMTGFFPEDRYAARDFAPNPEEEAAIGERIRQERERREEHERNIRNIVQNSRQGGPPGAPQQLAPNFLPASQQAHNFLQQQAEELDFQMQNEDYQ